MAAVSREEKEEAAHDRLEEAETASARHSVKRQRLLALAASCSHCTNSSVQRPLPVTRADRQPALSSQPASVLLPFFSSSSSSSPCAPQCGWHSLPLVLISLALSQLDLFSLLRCARVCRHWHRAQRTAETWTHRVVLINDAPAGPARLRLCDFAFTDCSSVITPIVKQQLRPPAGEDETESGMTAPDAAAPAALPSGRPASPAPAAVPAAAPALLFPVESCLPCLLPLRHLQIAADNQRFLPSFHFLSVLTSLRTLTIHLALHQYRALYAVLCSVAAGPSSLSSVTVLLDLRWKDLPTAAAAPELTTPPPARLPLRLQLHMRGFTGKWEDDWVDAFRRLRCIEALDLTMKHWLSLSDEHLKLILLPADEDRAGQQAEQQAERGAETTVKATEGEQTAAASSAVTEPLPIIGDEEKEAAVQSFPFSPRCRPQPLAFPFLHTLNLTGQSHLMHDFFSSLPACVPALSCLDLTNAMGTDDQALQHLSSLPELCSLSLTLHENIADAALHLFLASTPQLRRLHLSAKSQQLRKTGYSRVLSCSQLLPPDSPLSHLTVAASIRLRPDESAAGGAGRQAGSSRLQFLDWEGRGGGGSEAAEEDSRCISWMLRLRGLRELVLRLGADEWEEQEKAAEARRAVMAAELGNISAAPSPSLLSLSLVRVNGREARLTQWRHLAPRICFTAIHD